MSAQEARQDRALDRAGEQGLDALLVTDLANVRYLTGYVGTNATALLARDRRLLFTDFRYMESARRAVRGAEVVMAGRDLLEKVAAAAREAAPGGRLGFEAEEVSFARHGRLAEALPGIELVPTSGLVEALRRVKEPAEVERIRTAAAIADGAYRALAEQGLVGRREADVAWELEGAMRAAGAEGASFPVIVAGGANGALPHAVPRPVEIPAGTLVVVDMGALVEGYCSDCTRTFATGPLPAALAEAYRACLEAQRAALAACRPGVAGKDLDAVARDVIAGAGLGERFGHGLGHGVGLAVHEAPTLRPESADVLQPGDVVTIEPGIYLEGLGGVRIEDLVVVTPDGCDVLTGFTTDLVALG